MKRLYYVLSFTALLLIFFAFNCKSPTAPNSGLNLTDADVVCTEVWLKLDFADSPNGGQYEITRNGNIVLSGTLARQDTVLVDTTVLPSKNYTYTAYRRQNGKSVEQSSPLNVTTLDTTGSSFSWQLYKFGDFNATGMSSMLYSIAVINDTNIWALGQIYTGTGDSVQTYNAVHWYGSAWNLIKIPLVGPCSGGVLYPPLKAVSKLTDKEILVSDGGTIITYDGTTSRADCRMNPLLSGAINAIFNSNPNDIYAIGSTGTIVHFDSHSWNKIISGTSLSLFDIYSNNGNNIYVCGGNFQNYDGVLLEGNQNGFHTIAEGKALSSANQLFKPYFDGMARTVWVSNTGTVFFAGNWLYKMIDGQINFDKTLPGNYWGGNTSGQYWGFLSQIRGKAENQMILVGERNTIRYFNGIRWTQLGMPYDPNSNFTWLSVGMTNDLIVVVGYEVNPTNGIIMILKRQ